MKIEDNHYNYRIETKDPNGGSLDFIDIDTVEPLRCAYDVQDELNLETNEHIKRVEEIVLDANSTEFWYVDEARTSNTHLVCYFEEVQLMANKDHSMVDTNRSVFEYGKINSNEHQNTNFICTHVMDNGVSRLYMSIDKTTFSFATFNNETIKQFISMNPVTVWYTLRYEVIIPRSLSKGHLLTLGGQTDISLTTTSEQAKLPIMKFNIGDTQYTLDTNPIHINNTQEGTQIRNIVLEGNTPINYARGNGVNTTEATSDTRYDFAPFYDGQATIPNTVDGGYVSAKLYGDTMVNIAKPYGETPLLTATNNVTLCDDLLGANEESIVLADGEITEGRIVGDSLVIDNNAEFVNGFTPNKSFNNSNGTVGNGGDCVNETYYEAKPFIFKGNITYKKVLFYDIDKNRVDVKEIVSTSDLVVSTIPGNVKYMRFSYNSPSVVDVQLCNSDGSLMFPSQIQSVINPTVYSVNENLIDPSFFKTVTNASLTDDGIMIDGDATAAWQTFTKSSFKVPLLSGHTYKLKFFLLEGEYTGGKIKCNLSDNTAKEFLYTGSTTITPTTDVYLTSLSFYAPKGTGAKFGISLIETTNSLDTYIPYKSSQATLPYTLNKLPNGVADYIDVVNKVYVQRVGHIVLDGTQSFTYKNEFSSSYYYGFLAAGLLGSNQSTASSYGLCDKLKYQTNYNFSWSTDGEYVLINYASLFIKLSKDKLNSNSTAESLTTYLASNPITVLYELATPIYTPLTEEEIAQLPLSAYKDGYVNLSSNQLMPSFEFRMKASNRYQVDMLETGYYYLNAPTGNVKLGTANVDVQQMPCIVKVDNVGTGDSAYRLGLSNRYYKEVELTIDGYYLRIATGELVEDSKRAVTDFIEIDYYDNLYVSEFYKYLDMCFYDENKNRVSGYASWGLPANRVAFQFPPNAKYFRLSFEHNGDKKITLFSPITLAKLPSHRIPTSFTQGMKCATDFGYWEGVKVATGKELYVNETNKLNFAPIELNRIEYNNTIVEDEFDIATGKLTKRVGVKLVTVEDIKKVSSYSTDGNTYYCYGFQSMFPNWKSRGVFKVDGINYYRGHRQIEPSPFILEFFMSYVIGFNFNLNYSYDDKKRIIINELSNTGGFTVYYELQVPEISYISLSSNQVKTVANSTLLQSWRADTTYLNPQAKPSHLTYPVPSLVGNRTYTVVHNRKNISDSTKPIELNLGGTVVQLNDASSKTLVKTPSTLAHNNLIFIGGESTVDHIMVLDGDWTDKPIEYFENMKGHDTDAIITIIGDGKIEDVAEQYLW